MFSLTRHMSYGSSSVKLEILLPNAKPMCLKCICIFQISPHKIKKIFFFCMPFLKSVFLLFYWAKYLLKQIVKKKERFFKNSLQKMEVKNFNFLGRNLRNWKYSKPVGLALEREIRVLSDNKL